MNLSPPGSAHPDSRGGFTLAELMISVFIMMITIAGALALFLSYRHAWVIASLARNTSTEASMGMERIVYGVGTNSGLRAAELATVGVSYPSGGWRIDYNDNRFLQYVPATDIIVDEINETLCSSVIDSSMEFTNSGCFISLTVRESRGDYVSTNLMSSFVQFRN